jgi:hypothetical protein
MTTLAVVLALVIVLGAAFIARRPDPAAANGESAPMTRRSRAFLVGYFLVLAVSLIYLVLKLYLIDFPDSTVVVNASSGSPDVTGLSKSNGPVLFYAFPHVRVGATPASPPTYELALYGDRFELNAEVRLNGQPRPVKAMLEDNLIRVVPETADTEGIGSLVVEVANPGGRLSNALHLSISRPRMPLTLPIGSWPVTRETQLLLLVFAAGALGSFVHALKSLADFIGNRTAQESWFWWYVTRPVLGATLAFIFYAVLRGGFLTGTPADVKVVNPFGVIAVAALVGMFADKATHKLAEIFDILFKAEDKRGGKLAAPAVNELTPSTAPAGSSQPVKITIRGERLANASAVKVNGVERIPEKVEDKFVVVELLPSDLQKPGTLTISVVTPAGTSPAATLHVSTLAIPDQNLPARTVGTNYSATLVARGGTPDYTWKVDGLPDDLTLDSKKGEIAGTPKSAAPVELEVTVTDKTGASQSRELRLA